MNNVPECINFLITKLVSILTSEICWPFVGIWVASYVIYLLFQMIKFKGRRP